MSAGSWDGKAEEVEQGVSYAMAERMLSINPGLRERGIGVEQLMSLAQRPTGTEPRREQRKEAGMFELLKTLFDEVEREERRLNTAKAALEAERRAVHERAVDRLHGWLLDHDADLLSPVTRAALARHAAFFSAIGFSVEGYIDKQLVKK